MNTPAQKRASAKYDKEHTKGVYLKLNVKTDKTIIDHLNNQKYKQTYIKNLIKADMKLEEVENYLTLLENEKKAECLLGAIVTLQKLGYKAEYDVFQNRYFIKRE